jgi:smad nuclear-interacting protein 1
MDDRERSKRSRREDSDRHRDRERDRSRDRSRERRHRRRSRTPDSRRRRSRSRSGDRTENTGRRRRRSQDRRDRSQKHDEDRRGDRHSRRKHDHDSDAEENDKGRDKQVGFKRGAPLPSQDASFAISKGEEPEKPKEKPNYGITGALAAASNSIAQADGSAIVLKYHEPPEARKPAPKDQWKLFVFKGKDIIDTVELSHRSCWLVGRETSVVDLLAEHPSISKQHAVIQFRYTEKRNEYGDKIGKVKPYLIDLDSANGTILNGDKAPESRYLELRDKDLVQFGQSTREYVIMLDRQ